MGKIRLARYLLICMVKKGRGKNMSEDKEKEIKLEMVRKPLEPVGERVSCKQKKDYAKLLADYERIDGIRDSQVKGASANFDEKKKSYTVRAYNGLVKSYRAARAEYNRRYADSIETIEMIREKIRRLDEEDEQFEKEHPEKELPEVPEMKDVPDESWEDFQKRFAAFSEKMKAWGEEFSKQTEERGRRINHLNVVIEEMNKFPQLEYEFEMRLRHIYIDPKTGERKYLPDDDVGEGLICLGSRDYTPVLKDE